MVYEHRWTDVETWFFDEVNKFFSLEKVPRSSMDPVYSADNIYIYKMKKK